MSTPMPARPDWSTDEALDAWDRQPGEPDESYALFLRFRDLPPPRTTRQLAEVTGENFHTLRSIRQRWWWGERTRLWDSQLQAIKLAAHREEVERMAELHARVARQALGKVAARIVGDANQGVPPLDPRELSPSDAIRWMEVAAKLERLSRGLTTEGLAVTGADGGPVRVESRQVVDQLLVELDQISARHAANPIEAREIEQGDSDG